MRSPLAQAIRNGRLAMQLTQKELGLRLGLRGRAIYRWERDDSVPRKVQRERLVRPVELFDVDAAAKLKAAFESHAARVKGIVMSAAPPPPPARPTNPVALEFAIFAMADELDLAPRRVRASVTKLLARVEEAGYSL